MRSFWTKSAIAAAALACLGTAQAAVLTFEDPVDVPFLYTNDEISQQGFLIVAQDVNDAVGWVGTLVDGSDPGVCATVFCPTNNSSTYYAAVNDGIARLRTADGSTFSMGTFDAAFLGASGESLPGIAGLLRIEFDRADGSWITMQYLLPGPTSGQLGFSTFNAASGTKVGGTGTYTGEFTQAFFYGFTCNDAGNCNAFTTNRGQFALDNVNLVSAVPEPSEWLLMGLGLGAIGAVARRRKQQAAA